MREMVREMGQERVALRTRRTTVVLLQVASFVCLGVAFASLAGYYVPHAVGPSILLMVTAVVGFALSIIEARGS
ncbi:MAG TPA: hypothetical protein VFJ72_01020 [Rubrobacteraceae bacterium]|nr:hypothetical protein [Rubrobacteraceae bacterium]